MLRRPTSPFFFEYHSDPVAVRTSAFKGGDDPTNFAGDTACWNRLLNNQRVRTQTILSGEIIVGHTAILEQVGKREVTHWIGKEFWGQGITTGGLAEILRHEKERPFLARSAKDNAASLRVLERCGFVICGEDRGFANARNGDIEEYVLIVANCD